MTLVSANIRFVPILEGVTIRYDTTEEINVDSKGEYTAWRESVKRQWGNRKHGFSQLCFRRYVFGSFENLAKAIMQ